MANEKDDDRPKHLRADGRRFDHLVAELLEQNDGVFLGERHADPVMRQSLIKLLPMLKGCGVGTLSLELPQNIVVEMSRMKTIGELNRRWPKNSLNSQFELIKTAQTLGLRVLGHDKPWPRELEEALGDEAKHDQWLKVEGAYYEWATSEEGMNARNAIAAAHIQRFRTGKVLVLGGSSHSGNYRPEDVSDGQGEWNPIALDSTGIPKGIAARSQYAGLDIRLNIPSIDYDQVSPVGEVGATTRTNGKFSTYEVSLPSSLGELHAPARPAPKPGGKLRIR